jgi:hypothetical protein
MKVKELIEKLGKFNPEMNVLGEFDMDGDEFMVKVDLVEIYEDNGFDDSCSFEGDEDEMFCIIKLNS